MSRLADRLAGAADRVALAGEEAAIRVESAWRRLAALGAFFRPFGRRPLTWGTLAVVLFCPLAMLLLDRPLALALHDHVGANLEGFFKTVTNLGLAEYYLVPAGLLWLVLWLRARGCLIPAERRRRLDLAWRPGFLFLSVAASGVAENLVKVTLGRLRPRLLFEKGLYGFQPFNHEWAMNSFPSGHSQAAFAAMTALVILAPRYDLLWLLIAFLVAASRVVTTVHYLSDAVAGSWLGFAGALLIARALRARGIDVMGHR